MYVDPPLATDERQGERCTVEEMTIQNLEERAFTFYKNTATCSGAHTDGIEDTLSFCGGTTPVDTRPMDVTAAELK